MNWSSSTPMNFWWGRIQIVLVFRLESPEIFIEEKPQLISSPVMMGVVQMPNSGHPIVLMNDHQTTGGYPRIAKVIDNDLAYLAQSSAGTRIRFRKVTTKKSQGNPGQT